MNRLTKTESVVFLYYRFSLLLKDPFSDYSLGSSRKQTTTSTCARGMTAAALFFDARVKSGNFGH